MCTLGQTTLAFRKVSTLSSPTLSPAVAPTGLEPLLGLAVKGVAVTLPFWKKVKLSARVAKNAAVQTWKDN